MAGRLFRRPDEAARSAKTPPELDYMKGAWGPFTSSDRAEFHHGHQEAQQWFLRLDPEELADIRYSVKLAKVVRGLLKWTNRMFWSGLAAFGLVVTTGEKLAKLPETISGVIAAISLLWTALRGRLGL